MKFFGFCFLVFFSSCCGEGMSMYVESHNFTLILTNTTDRILKISYQNSDKVITPNDTISNFLVSNNTVTNIFIQTKNAIDTLSLSPKINYTYSGKICDGQEITKEIDTKYNIITHTFSNIVQKEVGPTNRDYTTVKNINFYITP